MVTTGIVYDKYSVIQKLQKSGFTRDQAEGIAEVLAAPDTSTLATTADLQELKVELTKWLAGVLIAHGLGTAALTVALIEILK
jgi:hypothetical protein